MKLKPSDYAVNTLIVGGARTGKTLTLVNFLLNDDHWPLIVTCGFRIDEEKANAYREAIGRPFGERGRTWGKNLTICPERLKCVEVEKPSDFLRDEFRHATWGIDEPQQFWPARGYKDTDFRGMKAMFEHGKRDARVHMACHQPRDLDQMPARFAEVTYRITGLSSWILMPDYAYRPDMMTRVEGWPEFPMRTGRGNSKHWFWKMLRVGTRVNYDVVNMESLRKKATIYADDAEIDPDIEETGHFEYDHRVAECYDSGALVRGQTFDLKKSDGARRAGAAAATPQTAAPAAPLPI